MTDKNTDFSLTKSLHDPEYTEWTAYIKSYDKEGSKHYHVLKHHVCGEEDWKLFHTPRKNKALQIQRFKERKMLLCLDKMQETDEGKPILLEELEIYGADRVSEAKLDFIYRPCTPIQRTKENKNTGKCLVDDVNDRAVLDAKLAEIKEYTGGMAILYTYFNNEEFNI